MFAPIPSASVTSAAATSVGRRANDRAAKYADTYRELFPAGAHGLVGRAPGDVITLGKSPAELEAELDLFDRAWPQFKAPIETHWRQYIDGRMSRDDAIKAIVAAVK